MKNTSFDTTAVEQITICGSIDIANIKQIERHYTSPNERCILKRHQPE